jgi:hypothetical protein
LFDVHVISIQKVLQWQALEETCLTVEIVAKKMILLKPHPLIDRATADFAMGVVREKILPKDATCILIAPAKPDHAWAILERRRMDYEKRLRAAGPKQPEAVVSSEPRLRSSQRLRGGSEEPRPPSSPTPRE